MTDENLIMRCGHCGNKTAFEKIAEHFVEEYSWYLVKCLTCSKPTLIQVDPYETIEDRKIVYPTAKTHLTNIPVDIKKEYEATLTVQYISLNACAVLARRTLEAIFIHENAAGRTLSDKVNNMIKSDRIPPLLADVAHLGRQIGNLGAHFDKEQVTEEDVTAMLDFLEAILEYMYVLPAKVAVIKYRLNQTP